MRALALVALLAACSGTPINPGPHYGGGSSVGGQTGTCDAMCDHLAEIGCPGDDCLSQCRLLTTDDRFGLDIDCRIKAQTRDEVRACGPASCME